MEKPEEAQRRQFLLIVNRRYIISSFSLFFFFQAIQFYEEKIRNEKQPLQIAQYYIHIGHWHLLLEDFPKGIHEKTI